MHGRAGGTKALKLNHTWNCIIKGGQQEVELEANEEEMEEETPEEGSYLVHWQQWMFRSLQYCTADCRRRSTVTLIAGIFTETGPGISDKYGRHAVSTFGSATCL